MSEQSQEFREKMSRRAVVVLSAQQVHQMLDLPEGAIVTGVTGDFSRMGVLVSVVSDDLPVVPDMVEPPFVYTSMSSRVIYDEETKKPYYRFGIDLPKEISGE